MILFFCLGLPLLSATRLAFSPWFVVIQICPAVILCVIGKTWGKLTGHRLNGLVEYSVVRKRKLAYHPAHKHGTMSPSDDATRSRLFVKLWGSGVESVGVLAMIMGDRCWFRGHTRP